jgi:hypothetical protein
MSNLLLPGVGLVSDGTSLYIAGVGLFEVPAAAATSSVPQAYFLLNQDSPMLFLRQSTASQEIYLGPFLHATTLATYTGAITAANIKLWVEGATSEAAKNSGDATLVTAGRYYAVLDATDTATVGKLEVHVAITDYLPVRREYMVLEEAVYDALFASSAAGYQVPIWAAANSTVNLSATTIKTATDVETDTADIQSKIGTPAGVSIAADIAAIEAQTDDIGAGGAGLNAIPWNASWDAEVQSEVADALTAFGASTLTAAAAADAVWDEAQADHVAAGSFGETATEIAAILVDTGTTLDGKIDVIDGIVDSILVDTAEIGAAGEGLTAINLPDQTMNITGDITGNLSGSVGSVSAIAANAVSASALATDAVTEIVTAILTTQMTESYNVDGVAPTLTQALMFLMQILSETSISSTTMTVKKLDGSTEAFTLTLNDGTAPTSIYRAT